jgi:hypothetical protein
MNGSPHFAYVAHHTVLMPSTAYPERAESRLLVKVSIGKVTHRLMNTATQATRATAHLQAR